MRWTPDSVQLLPVLPLNSCSFRLFVIVLVLVLVIVIVIVLVLVLVLVLDTASSTITAKLISSSDRKHIFIS